MKKIIQFLFGLLIAPLSIFGQIKVSPVFPTVNDNITITYDAADGNAALLGASPVYIHTGVLTTASANASDWKYVKYPFTTNAADNVLTALGANQHSISYNIKTYYGIPNTGVTAAKIACVFRNADGSKVGKTAANGDIFYDIWDGVTFLSQIVQPASSAITVPLNSSFQFEGATSIIANLSLRIDGTLVQAASDVKTITRTITASTPGLHTVVLKATSFGKPDILKSFTYNAVPVTTVQDPPSGLQVGANDMGGGTVTFLLKAPNKSFAYVVGTFNNWAFTDLMKRSADGTTFWFTKTGLTAGEAIQYQYNVDGIKIADPLSTLVLDPSGDGFVSSTTFPNKPVYPSGQSGYVTVFTPSKTAYPWSSSNVIHDKRDLVIYELLVRDFVAEHSYQGLIDKIEHFKSLGINAIELMPVNEFEGNESWGYNPNFHMALDKYYGPEDKLKEFINLCHQNNISVILDVVFNHAFGTSPLVQLYYSGSSTTPESPWFNPIATHPFSVGHDFKHGSGEIYTNEYMYKCLKYWLSDFKVDGFRYDLSKGFTQNNTLGNESAWNVYDQNRVDNWQRIYDVQQAALPNSYCILEHLGSDGEETELANRGMMLWKKMNVPYKQAAMGYASNSNLGGASPQSLGWTDAKFDKGITFMESHDELRLASQIKAFGNSVAGYDTKNNYIAMKRIELASAFFFTVPGPKMMWQGAEFGNDANSGMGNTANNPVNWNAVSDANRNRLFKVMANIINLKTKNPSVFQTNNHNKDDLNTGLVKHFHLSPSGAGRTTQANFLVTIIGNFDVVAQNITPYFQNTGVWYDYLSGVARTVNSTTDQINLQPGEYHIFTSVQLPVPPQGYTPFTNADLTALPVELITFTAQLRKNDAHLIWQTASEKNNQAFTIERSLDGKQFDAIGSVKGKGNATTISNYEFWDKNLSNGTFYYRLRQTDFDGQETLSSVATVNVGRVNKIKVFPNPTTDKIFIQTLENEIGEATLTDQLGRQILNFKTIPTEINVSQLPTGVYFLKIKDDNFKIVKQ